MVICIYLYGVQKSALATMNRVISTVQSTLLVLIRYTKGFCVCYVTQQKVHLYFVTDSAGWMLSHRQNYCSMKTYLILFRRLLTWFEANGYTVEIHCKYKINKFHKFLKYVAFKLVDMGSFHYRFVACNLDSREISFCFTKLFVTIICVW